MILNANALHIPLADETVQCVVTSPPYWNLRDYSVSGQLGLEPTPEEYVANMVAVFREVRRVMRPDGTCWLNLGSSYASGDMRPSQSRPLMRVPAYDSDGKAPRDYQDAGRVYPDSCDELLGENQIHRESIVHNDQSARPGGRLPLQKDRDSVLPGYAQAFLDAWLLDARASTNLSASSNDLDAFAQQARALVSLLLPGSFLGGFPLYADMLACISDIAEMSQTSNHHKLGRVLSFLASIGSLAGMDGITWAYFTIPSLKLQSKDLIMIPQLVALALQVDGWIVRSDIIWHKPNPMPESVTDRPTKAHEYIFLLTKRANYYYDAEAVKEDSNGNSGWEKQRRDGKGFPIGGNAPDDSLLRNDIGRTGNPSTTRNRRTVWTIPTSPYSGSHFATFPPDLVRPCILAGSSPRACEHCGAPWERVVERDIAYPDKARGRGVNTDRNDGGKACNADRIITTTGWRPTCTCDNQGTGRSIVLDPFAGTFTVGMVAAEYGRRAVGIELNPEYIKLAQERTAQAMAQEVMPL